ncbi:hypothetical protein CYMTET_31933, partial [Cymbomonas tetramitiformis]
GAPVEASSRVFGSFLPCAQAAITVIRLPAMFPLKPAEVECNKRMGVSEARLRKWLLAISAFLRNQNGAVVEAVHMWKKNIDKEFEGLEDCLISIC